MRIKAQRQKTIISSLLMETRCKNNDRTNTKNKSNFLAQTHTFLEYYFRFVSFLFMFSICFSRSVVRCFCCLFMLSICFRISVGRCFCYLCSCCQLYCSCFQSVSIVSFFGVSGILFSCCQHSVYAFNIISRLVFRCSWNIIFVCQLSVHASNDFIGIGTHFL